VLAASLAVGCTVLVLLALPTLAPPVRVDLLLALMAAWVVMGWFCPWWARE
jgi:hypothetical protein